MRPEVIRYILTHRNTYTRGAITHQLISAGHDPAAIEAIWQAIETGQLPPPPPGEPPYDLGPSAPSPAPAAPSAVQEQPAQPAQSFGLEQPAQPSGLAPQSGATSSAGEPAIVQRPVVAPRPTGLATETSRKQPIFWVMLIGFVVVHYILSLVGGLATADTPLEGAGATIVFGVGWLIGLVLAIVLRGSNRHASNGLFAGIVTALLLPIVLTFLAVVILGGICLVLMSTGT